MKSTEHLNRRQLLSAAGALAYSVVPGTHAQTAQSKFIVAAAPGGTTDLLTRHYAQWLGEAWGRTVIVDNRPGAGGVIATQLVQRSTPDGSTLMLAALSHVANLAMMDNVHYDPVKDFTPIAKLLNFGSVLVVHPSVPAKDIRQFIAYAKAKPDKLNWALGATGTSQHLAGVLLAREAGLKYTMVPYKGGGPAMNDLLAGQCHFMIESIPTAIPHIQARRIIPLAVTGSHRSSGLPDVPTIAEAAIPGFNVEAWFALMGPAGLPADFVNTTYQHLRKIMDKAEVRSKLTAVGATPDLRSPQETRMFIESESAKWLPLIQAAGIKIS